MRNQPIGLASWPNLRARRALSPKPGVSHSRRLSAAIVARLAEGDFSTFVSGDDAQAKATVVSLLESMGHRDVIDLGDITSARGVEMMMPIWLRLWSGLGTPMFTFKIVR